MARIDPIPPDQMTEEQRAVDAEIAAKRTGGNARGPFALWLRDPELARRADAFGSYVRSSTSVPRRLSELAILTVARHWTAQYEWFAHENHVIDAGLTQDVVDAIKARRRPDFSNADDEAVYDLCMEINENRAVSDETYARSVERLGEQMVLDLVTTVGFYTMVATLVVTFQIDIPGGGPLPLEP
jgi:4-carboxymuconolactone decarboxylase